ncbi:MAG: hypothetical protein ACYC5N_09055 [Endomicrobiales bacterium]
MNEQEYFDELRKIAVAEGMALFGAADVRPLRDGFLIPAEVAAKFDLAVSLGLRLSKSVLETVENAPNQLYYFHYQRANILLDQTALKVMAFVQSRGFDAFPVPASQVMDWEKQLGTVSHREIARRAGLGWYGKNNLLVNERFGSQVRYASVLTNMPLPAAQPVPGRCGACRACLDRCPAGAIKENGFDREACHLKLKEFTKIQRIGQMICGVCLKACPGKNGAA